MVKNHTYETREVTHGTAYGAFAPIAKDETTGVLSFDAPQSFTGLRSVKIETAQDSNPQYADNIVHVSLLAAKTVEGSITTFQFPKTFLPLIGKKIMDNGGLTDTGTFKRFAWQYIETVTTELGDTYDELHVLYNVQASAPTAEATTDEDSPEGKEFEVPITANPSPFVFDAENGRAVTEFVLRRTEANSGLFDEAYSRIILPTDVAEGSPS